MRTLSSNERSASGAGCLCRVAVPETVVPPVAPTEWLDQIPQRITTTIRITATERYISPRRERQKRASAFGERGPDNDSRNSRAFAAELQTICSSSGWGF